MQIERYESPRAVQDRAQGFLGLDPLRNTLVLTILQARIADSQPGRYWVASRNGQVVGVAAQAPLTRPLVLSLMPLEVAASLATLMAGEDLELQAVSAEAQIASRFAAQWAECRRIAVRPVGARRLYQARSVRDGAVARGSVEPAASAQEALAHDWQVAFCREIGESTSDALDFVRRRIEAGLAWLWTDDGFRSIAFVSAPVVGTARFQAVYTPPQYRRKGYAESLVRAVTRQLLGTGLQPMLFTDLADPVANGVYQRIGYEGAAEMMLYRFEARIRE